MQDHQPDILEHALLSLLLVRHPAPVHRSELEHAFAGDDWPAAVSALVADGVLHQEGSLHLVSRPAARVAELLAG